MVGLLLATFCKVAALLKFYIWGFIFTFSLCVSLSFPLRVILCVQGLRVRMRRFRSSSLCNSSQLDQCAGVFQVNCRRKYSRKSTKQMTLHLHSRISDSRPSPDYTQAPRVTSQYSLVTLLHYDLYVVGQYGVL